MSDADTKEHGLLPQTPLDAERAVRILEIIADLIDVNLHVPVVVEGKRDKTALRRLGLEGEIIVFNSGAQVYDFCENISGKFGSLVLLLDWDREGERLQKMIRAGLDCGWEEYAYFRERLKALCQKDIKDIEGIPALIRRLQGHEA